MYHKLKIFRTMKLANQILKAAITFTLFGLITQATAQERQISFCNDIKIIDTQMATRVSKLMVYKDFQQATLLETDEGLVLSIVYKINGVFQLEKVSITPAELAQICEEIKLKEDKAKFFEEDNPTQEARRRLIVSSTLLSLGYYSWAIPTALHAEDYKVYTASYMIIGGAGFFVPLFATNRNNVTNGMARGYSMGAVNGFVHGLALNTLLMGESTDIESILGITTVTSLTESLLALSLAKKHNLSWGRMSIMGSGGLWGAAVGNVLPYVLFGSTELRLHAATTLAGSAGGILGANYLYKKQSITHGDATIINSMGALGLYWSGVMMETFEFGSDRGAMGLMLLGATGGITYGIYKTKNYNYTRQQGNLIPLGAFAGGLIGAGFGILTEAETTGYLWLTALGATGGFFLSDWVLRDGRKEKNTSASNYSFQINPMGVMGAVNSNYLPKVNDPRVGNTIASLQLTF